MTKSLGSEDTMEDTADILDSIDCWPDCTKFKVPLINVMFELRLH